MEISDKFKVGLGLNGDGVFYVYDGYKYYRHRTNTNRKMSITFRCAHKVPSMAGGMKNCGATLEQIKLGCEVVIRETVNSKPHCHGRLDYPLAEISHFREELRKRAANTRCSAFQVYRDLSKINPELAVYYPFDQARSMMYRARKKDQPTVPGALSELGDYLGGDGFNKYGSLPSDSSDTTGEGPRSAFFRKMLTTNGKKTNTSLVFSDKVFVDNFLRKAGPVDLIIDATFKICPKKPSMCQMLSVHAHSEGQTYSLAFVMMEAKTQEDYRNVLQYIKTEIVPSLDVTSLMCDFDTVLINAVKEVFEDVRVSGCHFHYAQALWECAKQLGLTGLADFVEECLRRLIVLPYLCPNEILAGFEAVKKVVMHNENLRKEPKVVEFLTYMFSTWLHTPQKRRTISVWNSPLRTNNCIESFYTHIFSSVGRDLPNIWMFLETIADTQICCRQRHAAVTMHPELSTKADYKSKVTKAKNKLIMSAEEELKHRRWSHLKFLDVCAKATDYALVILKAQDMPRNETDDDEPQLTKAKKGKVRKAFLEEKEHEEAYDAPHPLLSALEKVRQKLCFQEGTLSNSGDQEDKEDDPAGEDNEGVNLGAEPEVVLIGEGATIDQYYVDENDPIWNNFHVNPEPEGVFWDYEPDLSEIEGSQGIDKIVDEALSVDVHETKPDEAEGSSEVTPLDSPGRKAQCASHGSSLDEAALGTSSCVSNDAFSLEAVGKSVTNVDASSPLSQVLFVNVDEGSVKIEMVSDNEEEDTNNEIDIGGKLMEEENMEEGSIGEEMITGDKEAACDIEIDVQRKVVKEENMEEGSTREEVITGDKEGAFTIGIDIEEKAIKEENTSDEEGAAVNEEKVFLGGEVKVDYPFESYEYKSTTNFGSSTPNLQSTLSDHKPMFPTKEVTMEDDDLSGTQQMDVGSTSIDSGFMWNSAAAHSVQEEKRKAVEEEDQSNEFRGLTCKAVHQTLTRRACPGNSENNESLKASLKLKNGYHSDESERSFWQSSGLKEHKLRDSGEKPFRCDECGQRFSRSRNLKMHKMTHTGEKPFQCDECERRFLHSNSLKRHKKTHTEEKPFQCDQCERSFLQSSNLKKHKLTHFGEKPFGCDECGQRFSRNRRLDLHKMTHTGEKPFHCDECGRRYLEIGDLRKHKVTHTGERPFQCDMCERRFFQRNALNRHRMVHNRKKPVPV